MYAIRSYYAIILKPETINSLANIINTIQEEISCLSEKATSVV